MIESVEDHQDPKELISTQRLLIDVLRKENAAFRILKTQVEKLRKENNSLRTEVSLLRTTTGADYHATLPNPKSKGGKNKVPNGDVRRANSEDRLGESNGPLVNGHGDLTNGLTNGHMTHNGVNGLTNGVDGVDGGDLTRNGRHPNQKLSRENGAGTSGTSLITG